MNQQPSNEIELLQEINKKLDKLIGVTAINGKTPDLQAKILRSLGFNYEEVSRLTGIPSSTLKTRDLKKKGKQNERPTTSP